MKLKLIDNDIFFVKKIPKIFGSVILDATFTLNNSDASRLAQILPVGVCAERMVIGSFFNRS